MKLEDNTQLNARSMVCIHTLAGRGLIAPVGGHLSGLCGALRSTGEASKSCLFRTNHLNEAVVETQVVAYGVLPRGPPLAVVRELLKYVVAYLVNGEQFVGRLRYGHGD